MLHFNSKEIDFKKFISWDEKKVKTYRDVCKVRPLRVLNGKVAIYAVTSSGLIRAIVQLKGVF